MRGVVFERGCGSFVLDMVWMAVRSKLADESTCWRWCGCKCVRDASFGIFGVGCKCVMQVDVKWKLRARVVVKWKPCAGMGVDVEASCWTVVWFWKPCAGLWCGCG